MNLDESFMHFEFECQIIQVDFYGFVQRNAMSSYDANTDFR